MGIFDMFRRDKQKPLQKQMVELAPKLFPGGHEQILDCGKRISAMLDGRIPAESASKLYASAKYFAHTATDRSRGRVIEYIVRGGMGLIDAEQAGQIHDTFILDHNATSLEDVVRAFSYTEISAVLKSGRPEALTVDVALPSGVIKKHITTHDTIQKIVSILSRRVKSGYVVDDAAKFRASTDFFAPEKIDYTNLKVIVISSDGKVMFQYDKG